MITSLNIHYTSKVDLYNAKTLLANHPSNQILIQVFSGQVTPAAIETLLNDLRTVFPNVPILGTTTGGEILNEQVLEYSIVINISLFEHTTVRTLLVDNNDDLTATGEAIGDGLKTFQPAALILFGCGLKNRRTIDATSLLSTIYEKLPQTIIAGAQAGDNGKGENTLVFTEAGMTDSGVAAAALSGDKLIVNNRYNLSWVPIGKKMTITKVDGARVYSIDNCPPYTLYSHYLGQEVADGLPLSAADFPLIIERNGIPMAIHAIGVNDDGSFEYIHSFQPGEQLQFGFCHAGLLALGAQETFNSLRTEPVQAAFIYSCVSRKWILGEDIKVEIAPIATLAPTAGFFAYGEYFTFPRNECLFFSQTMTVLTLAETEASSAPIDRVALLSDHDSKQLKTLRVLHRLVETSAREIESINAKLAELANKDSLTELSNRRHLDERLEHEFYRAVRSVGPISLIMLDVDCFKLFNDTYGHVEGDNCLRSLAGVLKVIIHRPIDVVARYGGEEFICVLPATCFNGAMLIAEKIRAGVENLSIAHRSSIVVNFVTVSVGVITVDQGLEDMSPEYLIKLCDEQLYQAKSRGRNQVAGIAL
jgi:diguanylate cyclase (GGDEF)-like protein